MCTERFEKLSTAQLTCSEGALFPIHGNEECAINWALPGGSAQQRGEGEEEEEEEGRQYNATNCNELFMLHWHGQVGKKLDIYRGIGSLL